MELMAQAGLTPMQVIVAATGSAAQFLGTKELGTLEPGRWADLIVLDRNPLQDIRNTRAIQRRLHRREPGTLSGATRHDL